MPDGSQLASSGTATITLDQLRISRPLAGLRVLIVVENLPVPFDRRVWIEARTLAAAGASVRVICPKAKGHDEALWHCDGITVYRHPMPGEAHGPLGYLLEYSVALFWEMILTLRIAMKHGIDVIHGCNPPDLIFLVALPLRLFGVRYLFDHHDINPELFEAKFSRRGVFWRLLRWAERATFASASVSIATNESYRAIAIKRGGMSPENVFVVRSGPDPDRLKPVAPVAGWKNNRTYLVGYVGVMGAQEGIDLLLQAVAHLVHDLGRRDIQFCLVGGGPSLDKLRDLSGRMGVQDYVTFTGRAPDKSLFEVLSTADICVNPDRVNVMNDKSTMNKILEYMAFGKPIVQFDVTEGRYSAGDASLYARPNDPVSLAENMARLLADPAARAKMAQIGRRRIETRFSWPHQVPALIAAYQKLMSGHWPQQRDDEPFSK